MKVLSASTLLLTSSTLVSCIRYDGSSADLVHKMSKFTPGLHSHLEKKAKEVESLVESSSSASIKDNPYLTPYFLDLDSSSKQPSLDSYYLSTLSDQESEATATPTFTSLPPNVTASTFTQPLDHFDHTNNATFEQRFWFSTRYYKKPEDRKKGQVVPIFVLDSGETDAEGRLPYLDTGILDIMSEATGGIGIVLEHRYYGQSFPNRKDLGPGEAWGTDQLRFLTNKQALQDSADFVSKVTFPGLSEDLTSPNVPYIYYGGSYPGAKSALQRVLYPDLFYGAIASSAVTEAIEEYFAYFFPIARGGETQCVQNIQSAIKAIDEIIAPEPEKGIHQTERKEEEVEELLKVFNLKGLSELGDLGNLLTYPLGAFQSLNWNPAISSPAWDNFCRAMTDESTIVPSSNPLSLPTSVFSFAHYLRGRIIDSCVAENTPDECFGSSDFSGFVDAMPTDANGKAWLYQVCTTWGFFQTAPPIPQPPHLSGPKLISSLIDLEFSSEVCRKGFPPGEFSSVPAHPNVSGVNDIGGFNLEYERLAFIDGQFDPWRSACVHSEDYAFGGDRKDTLEKPFKLIPDCWHHCDENGLDSTSRKEGKEPERIRKIHEEILEFVKFWLDGWEKPKKA